jgi:IS605 OrfB family transposase
MSDINHQVSKTLVEQYGQNSLFVLEDLTGVSFNTDDLPKTLRNSHRSWAFYQLEQFLTYKAHNNASEVVKVPAKYTSQRCPMCGIIRKDNRNHENHLYTCHNCDYKSNDDRIGAMNIHELGKMYLSGTDALPKFELTSIEQV